MAAIRKIGRIRDHRPLQAGDRSAFHMLVERYQRRAYGIAFGMLRNREDALDAAQDAFIRRNIESFKGDSSFYTWFYRIVVNVYRRCRKQKRMGSVEYDDSYRGGMNRGHHYRG